MIKNKKKILTRILATVFAVAFAVLPLGLFSAEKNKVEASAEAFNGNNPNYPLAASNSWLNPLSFFDFSILRPIDDWNNTFLTDLAFNTYSFGLPRYISNVDYLVNNNVYFLDTVFNYMPLYSGSFRYKLNHSSSNPNGSFFADSFPKPLNDYSYEDLKSRSSTNTFTMSCSNVLIPFNTFVSLLSSESFVLSMQANTVSGGVSFLYLDDSVEPYEYKTISFSLPLSGLDIGNSSYWYFSTIFESLGITADVLSNYVFSNDINALYVKSFNLVFSLNSSGRQFDTVYNQDVVFVYALPADSSLMVTKQDYVSLSNTFTTFIQNTSYIPASPIDSVMTIVDSFFDFEIFPGFSLSIFLTLGLCGIVLGFAIKIFLHG